MLNFKLSEVEHSNTAKAKGMKNELPRDLMDNAIYLITCLQSIRDVLGCPMIINSGYRCKAVNDAVGGSKTSAHMKGLAADFIPKNMGLREAYDKIKKMNFEWVDQLIIYPSKGFLHIGLTIGKPRKQYLEK